MPHPINDERAQLSWQEFQVLSAVRGLRDLDENHPYVRAIEDLLEEQKRQHTFVPYTTRGGWPAHCLICGRTDKH